VLREILNTPFAMNRRDSMVATQEVAYFILKSAIDYRFYNRVGQRVIILKKGDVLTANTKGDVAYFRARGDVLIETTEDGTPLDQVGLVNGFNQKTTKSYKVYGRSAKIEQAPTPPTIPVGRQNLTQAPLPASPADVNVPAVYTPTPALPSETVPVGHTNLPSELRAPGLPTSGPRFNHARAGFESPIEEVSSDGTTVVTAPTIDPGQ
jgi:hypothetical protein